MEQGSLNDPGKATFTFVDEDHTLANAVRFCLNQDPRVSFCGYSIPHPSDARVNIRIQTTGEPAREVLKDGCQNMMLMCQHVRSTVDNAVANFRAKNSSEMETDSGSD
ncbi:DNA-directed RNA polymerases I and III subunit RPAC2 [Linum grandiflorum]